MTSCTSRSLSVLPHAGIEKSLRLTESPAAPSRLLPAEGWGSDARRGEAGELTYPRNAS